ncbi:MAG TPA: hypothetical protein VGD65_21775 [Chryseosolibacter sp.]
MTDSRTYTIISKGGIGEFKVLTATNEYITVFSYKNWFSSAGSANTKFGKVEIKAMDGWESSFHVFCDGNDVGEIHFNWKGNIIITLENAGGEKKTMVLKNVSLKSDWVLQDENADVILTLHSDTHWTKVDYRYDVQLLRDVDIPIPLLLIACGYGTNLNMSMIAALIV